MSKQIDAPTLKARLDAGNFLQIVDVRSYGEYESGHIPKAINVPLEQIEARLGDLADSEVVLVCQSGQRAGMACERIAQMHPSLTVLDGGTDAWVDAGMSVVRSGGARWSLERQVRLIAGLLALTGVVLALTVNINWLYLSGFIGAGLTFAGLTNVCGMAAVLRLLPWNRPAKSKAAADPHIA